jgi:cell division protein FtsL
LADSFDRPTFFTLERVLEIFLFLLFTVWLVVLTVLVAARRKTTSTNSLKNENDHLREELARLKLEEENNLLREELARLKKDRKD